MIRVYSTKQPDEQFIRKAESLGLQLSGDDFISIKATETRYDVAGKEMVPFVFTSANAVKYAKGLPETAHPYFCLSGKTAEVCQKKWTGSTPIAVADDGALLVEKIISASVKKIIFPCGNRRMNTIPDLLKSAGIEVEEWIVYETLNRPVELHNKVEAIMFFSPSAVESFFELNALSRDQICFTIGNTTAAAVRKFTDNAVIASTQPSPEAVLEDIALYFKLNKSTHGLEK